MSPCSLAEKQRISVCLGCAGSGPRLHYITREVVGVGWGTPRGGLTDIVEGRGRRGGGGGRVQRKGSVCVMSRCLLVEKLKISVYLGFGGPVPDARPVTHPTSRGKWGWCGGMGSGGGAYGRCRAGWGLTGPSVPCPVAGLQRSGGSRCSWVGGSGPRSPAGKPTSHGR